MEQENCEKNKFEWDDILGITKDENQYIQLVPFRCSDVERKEVGTLIVNLLNKYYGDCNELG